MKWFLLLLILLTGCGTYLGSEGLIYYPGVIADGGNVILGGEVVMGAVEGVLGGWATYLTAGGGAIGILISIFITKRKKGK